MGISANDHSLLDGVAQAVSEHSYADLLESVSRTDVEELMYFASVENAVVTALSEDELASVDGKEVAGLDEAIDALICDNGRYGGNSKVETAVKFVQIAALYDSSLTQSVDKLLKFIEERNKLFKEG